MSPAMASAVSHPLFARAFPAMSRALEAGRIAGHRTDLLAGLTGQVNDIGAGAGPRPLGFDARGREVLTFLAGETVGSTRPRPGWVYAEDTLRHVTQSASASRSAAGI
jgi:hypothetical protein